MTSQYIHIAYFPSGSFLHKVILRLLASSSDTLKQRASAWGQTDLSARGIALATKLEILQVVSRRIDDRLAKLSTVLEEDLDRVSECLKTDAGFPVPDRSLPFDILADVDAFMYEARSAYEIVGKFLHQFFGDILHRQVSEAQIRAALTKRGLKTDWIDELQANRILFFHETAPWIAVECYQLEPFKGDLIVLREGTDFSDPADFIRFDELRRIYTGFAQALSGIGVWLDDEIGAYESAE